MHIQNNFKIIPPLIPNLKSKNYLDEKFPEEIKEDVIYIELFIYDCHISIFLISSKENNRINLKLDISHHHFNREKGIFFFLKNFLRQKNNKILQINNIQAYS